MNNNSFTHDVGLLSDTQLKDKDPYEKDVRPSRNQSKTEGRQMRPHKGSLTGKSNKTRPSRPKETAKSRDIPSLNLSERGLSLDYHGTVAGHPVTVPIDLGGAELYQIRDLLNPIIGLFNAAIKARALEGTPLRDKENKPLVTESKKQVCSARSKEKAIYAYQELLRNPEVAKYLSALGDALAEATSNMEVVPGRLEAYYLAENRDIVPYQKINADHQTEEVIPQPDL